jgi:membrane protein required for colicin V production
MSTLSWIDWALLAVLSVSVLIGLVRGFVFEIMALAGWIVAWFGAQWAAPQLAAYLPIGAPGGAVNIVTAFALAFLAVLVAWSLLARLVRMLIQATPLSLADRALGAGFGLVRGAMLLLVLATLVMLTPAARSAEWQSSTGAAWLRVALQGLKPLLPAAMAERLPA